MLAGAENDWPSRRELTTKLDNECNEADLNEDFISSPKALDPEQRETKTNSINEMRKNLLERPDWLGLSVCRPPDMHLSAASEEAKIGRHRKQAKMPNCPAANSHSNSRNHSRANVLGKRKRDAEHDPSESSAQHSEAIPSHESSSPRSPRTPASSPPTRVHRSDSTKTSNTDTSLSLPPIPLFDRDRSTYKLVNDQADLEDVAEDLIPLDIARNMQSFDNVQERYINSRSSCRRGVGQGTSRSPIDVDKLTSPLQLDTGLNSGLLEPRMLTKASIQNNLPSVRHFRLLELFDNGDTSPARDEKHQGKYQLNRESAGTAHADSDLRTEQRRYGGEGVVSASSHILPFFPLTATDEVDVRDFALDVPSLATSARTPTYISSNRQASCQPYAQKLYLTGSASHAESSDHQAEHWSEIQSQRQGSIASKPTIKFKLDETFDPPSEHRSTVTRPSLRMGPSLASQNYSLVLANEFPGFSPEESTSLPAQHAAHGSDDEVLQDGPRSSVLPARAYTTMPDNGSMDGKDTSIAHLRYQRTTQGDSGNRRADDESPAISIFSQRSGKRNVASSGFSSSPIQAKGFSSAGQHCGPLHFGSLQQGLRLNEQLYSKSHSVTLRERAPRDAAYRRDPRSSIFSTPQKQTATFVVHSIQSPFPLSYSGGPR